MRISTFSASLTRSVLIFAQSYIRKNETTIAFMAQKNDSAMPQIPGYDLIEILGKGASGRVYLGHQLRTGRKAAVKILENRFDLEGTEIDRKKRRFEREISIVAELNHPNIVQLLDKGETDTGALFAAFQYIPGATLKDKIKEKQQLTITETVHFMSQILDGLICAHGAGIIHRDIKPQNLIISDQSIRGHAMILDYGIGAYKESHARATSETFTLDNEMLGTPAYAAPEQLCAMPVSPGSDLYAWALVFLECLLGRTVFTGASIADIIHQQLSLNEVKLPSSLATHPLGDILTGCLKKDPLQRANSAEKVFQQLNAIDIFNLDDLVKQDTDHALHPVSSGLDETRISNPEHKLSGERRQITVLSCGLDLITQNSSLDIEDSETSLKQCKNLIKTLAHQQGAYLANEFSDSLIFYFGYPRISEFNARNAANVALNIMNSVKHEAVFPDISIGIHTGFFLLLERALPEGVTAHLAKKLEQRATAGEILLSHTSQQLVKPFFVTELAPQSHTSAGEQVFALQSERHSEAQTKHFIGRKAEQDYIKDVLKTTASGTKCAVLVSGEPGIGKSSLLRQINDSLVGGKRIALKCSQEHATRMLYPFTDFFRKTLNIESESDPQNIARSVYDVFSTSSLDIEDLLPIVFTWLGLTPPDRVRPTQLSGERQRVLLAQSLAFLLNQYFGIENRILLIDDLQWADRLTLSFFDDYLEVDKTTSAILVAGSRPVAKNQHYPADWLHITLDAISDNDSYHLIQALLGSQQFSDDIVKEIITRSDGIPLYIEHLTLMLLGLQQKSADKEATQLLEDIPSTLRELLGARLDTMDFCKQLAQYASVIGREFDLPTLASISAYRQEQLEQCLEILSAAKIFTWAEDKWLFSHALIHEAAYESVLNKDKKHIHGIIAQLFAEDKHLVRQSPEVIATHAYKAGRYSKAIKYSLKAAKNALSTAETATALSHCDHASSALSHIRSSTVSDELELEIASTRAYILVAQRGYSDDEVKNIYAHAYTLIKARTDSELTGPVVYGLFSYHCARAEYQHARDYAAQLLASGLATADLHLQLVAQNSLGLTSLLSGDLSNARIALNEALSLSNTLGEHSLMPQFGGDFRGYCRSWYAILQALSGDIIAAKATCREALKLCKESRLTCAFVLAFPALEQLEGDLEGANQCALQLIDVSNKYGFDFFKLIGTLLQGWVQGQTGETDKGIASISQALDIIRQAALFSFLPRYHALLAEVHIRAGDLASARENLRTAVTLCRRANGNFYKAEIFRLYAELLTKMYASPTAIHRSLRIALATATKQGASLWIKKTASTVEDIACAFPDRNEFTSLRDSIDIQLK